MSWPHGQHVITATGPRYFDFDDLDDQEDQGAAALPETPSLPSKPRCLGSNCPYYPKNQMQPTNPNAKNDPKYGAESCNLDGPHLKEAQRNNVKYIRKDGFNFHV